MDRLLNPMQTMPIIDRLRKSRGRWRLLAIIALVALGIAMTARIVSGGGFPDQTHIARVIVDGTVLTDAARLATLKSLEENDQVEAVIIRINSPGGTTAGGEELYQALLDLSEAKPVVAVINELGASAAYMTAIGTDRIFARRLSLVGSIGVLVQHVDAGGLLRTIGIDFDKVQSGPLKAEPDIDDPLAGDVRASLQALVDDSFDWFVDIVAERRGLDREVTLELADGRIMTGRVALDAGLIDEFGGEREAQAWLEQTHDLTAELDVLTYYPLPPTDFERLSQFLGQQAHVALGGAVEGVIGGSGTLVELDGLVSLWHPVP